MLNSILLLTLISIIITFSIKIILHIKNIQMFNLRGMPSGHAAIISSILLYLCMKGSNSDLFYITFIIFSLYITDLLIIYYYGSTDNKGKNFGHSLLEIIIGSIIGLIITFTYLKIQKK